LPDGDSVVLVRDRLLAFEAMHLLISIDRNLREARAQWKSGLVPAADAYSPQGGLTVEKAVG
jgi:hypothetical protein